MSTPKPKSDYLLLLRGTDWDKGLSPEEIQKVMNRLMQWLEGLQRSQRVKTGQPLGEDCRLVSGQQGRMVADGPYAESKEAIGGYLVVEASDIDEAVALAKSFPPLDYGASVEIRPVAQECPTYQRVREHFIDQPLNEHAVVR